MNGNVEQELRSVVRQAFNEPRDSPDLAGKVVQRHRRRRARRVASASVAGVTAAAVAVVVLSGNMLSPAPRHTSGTGGAPTATVSVPTVSRLTLVPSVLDWGYQNSAGEDFDRSVLTKADAQWLASDPGKGAPVGSAKLSTLFAVPPGAPDAASIALLQFDTASKAHWVGFAVETAGTVTLQRLQLVPPKGVGQVSAILHLTSGDQFVSVAGPEVTAATVTTGTGALHLTAEGGGVFTGPVGATPSLLTLRDSTATILFSGPLGVSG